MKYIPVIGLEVHAELSTATKMFCGCVVMDVTQSLPNSAVCPVCMGLPGALPVVNKKAVELGLRAALTLECTPLPYSIFARKNYFYPDLPKGYQISQYETPLAENGRLKIQTKQGEKIIRIRRTHLEEDTGKLTHVSNEGEAYTLVDLNRAGIPLLEIVTEPDMHSVEEVKAYAVTLQQILRYIQASSCDMENGAIRFEANVSVMPEGSENLGIRTEIKNLNSFRSLERAIEYEISRQIRLLDGGSRVTQETVGWNETENVTFSQRNKEEAHDYRYFPEPDLPPLVVDKEWVENIRMDIPELPAQKSIRFSNDYNLTDYDISILVSDKRISDYFESLIQSGISPKPAANWITGQLFTEMNALTLGWDHVPVSFENLADLIQRVESGGINLQTAKSVLSEMIHKEKTAAQIIEEKGLSQIRDLRIIKDAILTVITENPKEVASYLAGKETLLQWFFGQVMRKTGGQASPVDVKTELEVQLTSLKDK